MRGVRQRIGGEMRLGRTARTVGAVAANGIKSRRHQWAVFGQTGLGCTMCMGTCGNGCRTVGTRITRARRVMGGRGQPGIVIFVSCAAAPGSTFRGTSARPTATAAASSIGATTSDSVLPGRSLPRSPHSASRSRYSPDNRFNGLGCRIARRLE